MSQARAWAYTLITNVTIVIIGIATGLIAARLLHPDGRGSLAALMFWPQLFAAIGALSLADAIVVLRRNRLSRISRLRGATLVIVLCLFVAVGAIGVLALPALIGSKMEGEVVGDGQSYLVAFVFLNYISLTAIAFDQGDLRFGRFNGFRLIQPLLYLLLLIALWLLDAFTPAACMWANIVALAVATLTIVIQPQDLPPECPRLRDLHVLARRAVRIHGHSILALLVSYADRAAVLLLFGNVENGLYIVAWTIASTTMNMVGTSFSMVFLPYSAASRSDISTTRASISRALRFAFLGCVATMIAVQALNPFLTPLLFGREFEAAVIPGAVLLLAFGVALLRQVIVATLKGIGQTTPSSRSEVAVIIPFALIAFPLSLAFRIEGIALAILIANIVGLASLWMYLRRAFGIRTSDCNPLSATSLAEIRSVMKRLRSQVPGCSK